MPHRDDKVAVGLIQMACALKDKRRNLDKALGFLEELRGKADIACLPELFSTGYHLDLIGDDFHDLAEPVPGPTTKRIGEAAAALSIAVLGTIVERDESARDALYDTTFIVDDRGRFVGKYRKSHLYPAEHRYFRTGDQLPTFAVGDLRIGNAICFEHAFPEIFTVLARQGAEVIFIPSAVPKGYEYLLDLRTRARAQDNQVFTVAVNRVGREGDVEYCGRSQVVNPRGEVLVAAPSDEELVLAAALDLSLILKEREQEPVLPNLRPELYRRFWEGE